MDLNQTLLQKGLLEGTNLDLIGTSFELTRISIFTSFFQDFVIGVDLQVSDWEAEQELEKGNDDKEMAKPGFFLCCHGLKQHEMVAKLELVICDDEHSNMVELLVVIFLCVWYLYFINIVLQSFRDKNYCDVGSDSVIFSSEESIHLH